MAVDCVVCACMPLPCMPCTVAAQPCNVASWLSLVLWPFYRPADERSPLCGHTHDSLMALNAEIVVTFEGTTEASGCAAHESRLFCTLQDVWSPWEAPPRQRLHMDPFDAVCFGSASPNQLAGYCVASRRQFNKCVHAHST